MLDAWCMPDGSWHHGKWLVAKEKRTRGQPTRARSPDAPFSWPRAMSLLEPWALSHNPSGMRQASSIMSGIMALCLNGLSWHSLATLKHAKSFKVDWKPRMHEQICVHCLCPHNIYNEFRMVFCRLRAVMVIGMGWESEWGRVGTFNCSGSCNWIKRVQDFHLIFVGR